MTLADVLDEAARKRQAAVDAIRDLTRESGTAPSFREVCVRTGMPQSTLAYVIEVLRAQGVVESNHGSKTRALRLAGQRCPTCGVGVVAP